MRVTIEQFALDPTNANYTAVGLVIMSHGDDKDIIWGACPEKVEINDNCISIRTDVLQQFSNLLAPKMKDVTKILIYQACR